MNRAKILRELMEKKGLKVSDVARLSGLAYSTVKYIFENGIDKASYSNVRKICAALNITTDALEDILNSEDETISLAAHFDGHEYSVEELNEIMEFSEFVKSRRK